MCDVAPIILCVIKFALVWSFPHTDEKKPPWSGTHQSGPVKVPSLPCHSVPFLVISPGAFPRWASGGHCVMDSTSQLMTRMRGTPRYLTPDGREGNNIRHSFLLLFTSRFPLSYPPPPFHPLFPTSPTPFSARRGLPLPTTYLPS